MKGTNFIQNNERLVLRGTGIKAPVRILAGGDSHIAVTDSRDDKYEENYRRMKQCASPENLDLFKAIVEKAHTENYDLLLLAGDILSFPSQAGIDAVSEILGKSKVPYLYTAGNHDWHFEGTPGSDREMREAWLPVLKLLYPTGVNQLCYSYDINGLKVIVIDNSVYEIIPEQLEFLKNELSEGTPSILLVHTPLYVPGRQISFSCGNPEWNASTDPWWEIERRNRWPESGHTETTFEFWERVFGSDNLIAIVSGHIHMPSLDYYRNTLQISLEARKPFELTIIP